MIRNPANCSVMIVPEFSHHILWYLKWTSDPFLYKSGNMLYRRFHFGWGWGVGVVGVILKYTKNQIWFQWYSMRKRYKINSYKSVKMFHRIIKFMFFRDGQSRGVYTQIQKIKNELNYSACIYDTKSTTINCKLSGTLIVVMVTILERFSPSHWKLSYVSFNH